MLKYATGFVLGAGVMWLATGPCFQGPCFHPTNPCAQVLVELEPYENSDGIRVRVLVDSVLVTFDPPSMTLWMADDTAQVRVAKYEEVFIR